MLTKKQTGPLYDRALIVTSLSLALIGLLMVASSSMEISEKQHGQFFYYVTRHIIYLIIGFVTLRLILSIPMHLWNQYAKLLFSLTFLLLLSVLIPGIGKSVNGSRRWISLFIIRLQVSELAKLTTIIYLAHYLSCCSDRITTRAIYFLRPLAVIIFLDILLLAEPDFGAVLVITTTTLSMLFLAGPPLIPFFLILLTCGFLAGLLIFSSSYRMARFITFFNPWKYPFGSGYQLTQALVACGRGGVMGSGLGGSVQKLFYLPEAHTDFIFAVLIEEFGLVGGLCLIGLFSIIVAKAFIFSLKCMLYNQRFNGYLAFGIGMNIGLSVIINIGVNIGLLPTKGLTLPLISYGGSSLIMTCSMIALLLRIGQTLK